MFPLLMEGSPRHATTPLMLLAGNVDCGAMVITWACDGAKSGVAGSPSVFGTVQAWPLRSMTTTWYVPCGIEGSGVRSLAARAQGWTSTSSVSRATGVAPGGRPTSAGNTGRELTRQGTIAAAPGAVGTGFPCPSTPESCRGNTRGTPPASSD